MYFYFKFLMYICLRNYSIKFFKIGEIQKKSNWVIGKITGRKAFGACKSIFPHKLVIKFFEKIKFILKHWELTMLYGH